MDTCGKLSITFAVFLLNGATIFTFINSLLEFIDRKCNPIIYNSTIHPMYNQLGFGYDMTMYVAMGTAIFMKFVGFVAFYLALDEYQ